MDRKAVLAIVLFDNLLNNFSFMDRVGFIRMLCFSINVKAIKQYIDLESTRV